MTVQSTVSPLCHSLGTQALIPAPLPPPWSRSTYHLSTASLLVTLLLLCFLHPTCHVCMLSHFSHVQLFVTLWTVAHPAPVSMGFFRQEYWSGLPFPPPGDLPDPEIEPRSLMFPALAGGFFTAEPLRKP